MSPSAGPSCSLRVKYGANHSSEMTGFDLKRCSVPQNGLIGMVKVREAGLEPATSRLSAGCSNRLSYPRNCKPADRPPRHKIDGAASGRGKWVDTHSFSSSISLIVMYDGNERTLSKVRESTTSSRRSRVRENAVIGTRNVASTPNSFWILTRVLTMTPL